MKIESIVEICDVLKKYDLLDRQALMLGLLLNLPLLRVVQLSRREAKVLASESPAAIALINQVIPHLHSNHLFWRQKSQSKSTIPRYGLVGRFESVEGVSWNDFQSSCEHLLNRELIGRLWAG